MTRWFPHNTRPTPPRRINLGDLIAVAHAVWRVAHVYDVPQLDERFLRVEFVAGANPPATSDPVAVRPGLAMLDVYYSHRWPMCSCCGEPMPCRAELADREAEAAMKRLAVMESRLPGTCWGCGEPITARQKVIRYEGENLDLPGGPPVAIHARDRCWMYRRAYERKQAAAKVAGK